ncbi:MAG: DctP family TRAP transporter solute-binding subunit [Hyphomicrobiales bacterium]|jgi:TRAP-type transport system periplasmic protein|nr:DctP family TRAP transporter solute-binding subunit [Hyphomicrobiales bacterium]
MRQTLAWAVAALLTATPIALTPAKAQTEIRISTAAPTVSPLTTAFNTFKEALEKRFPGQLKVSVHAASALFRQGTEIPGMQRGNLEMASPVVPEFEAQLPEWGALGGAYVFRDLEHMLKVFRGEIGQEFAKDVADKMGIVILEPLYIGTRTLNLRTDKPVRVPADLAGVKLRMPPGPGFQAIAKALGASSIAMPATEMYLGLKTGAIDGQDNPTNMTRDWKLAEVTQQIILTQHLVQPTFIAIARPFFEKLPADQQAAIRAAAKEAAEFQIAGSRKDEIDALEEFRKDGKMKVVEPDVAAFRAAVQAEYKASGLMEKWKPGLLARIEAVK